MAASDKPGKAMMRVTENFAAASLVWHRKDPSATELKIQTVSIDQPVKSGTISAPRFVKIDVDGAEDKVPCGMHGVLASAMPVLFVECPEAGRAAAWRTLRELGYQCQSAVTRDWVHVLDNYRHSDFLWLPPK